MGEIYQWSLHWLCSNHGNQNHKDVCVCVLCVCVCVCLYVHVCVVCCVCVVRVLSVLCVCCVCVCIYVKEATANINNLCSLPPSSASTAICMVLQKFLVCIKRISK